MSIWSFFLSKIVSPNGLSDINDTGTNVETKGEMCVCRNLSNITLFQQLNYLDLTRCKADSGKHHCICLDPYTYATGYWVHRCQAKHHLTDTRLSDSFLY